MARREVWGHYRSLLLLPLLAAIVVPVACNQEEEPGNTSPFAAAVDTNDCGTAAFRETYRNVIRACFPGRAMSRQADAKTILPGSAAHVFNTSQDEGATTFTTAKNWNYGLPYGAPARMHPAFGLMPAGAAFAAGTHILPPYNFGAVSQKCDSLRYQVAPTAAQLMAYNTCVTQTGADLIDTGKNYFIDDFHWYYLAHGHNCHDAAEDVAQCLLNANPRLPAACRFDARIVVFDSQRVPEANRKGDIYHSQILVTLNLEAPSGRVVCLVESQRPRMTGRFGAGCCVPYDARLLDNPGGDYNAWVNYWKGQFAGCTNADGDGVEKAGPTTAGVAPTLYTVANFRNQRETGSMDMDNGYDRMAGFNALGGGGNQPQSEPPPSSGYDVCCSPSPADCINDNELGPPFGVSSMIARTVDVLCSDAVCPDYGDLP